MATQQMADWKAENARIHRAAQTALSKALREGTVPSGTLCGMTTVYANALALADQAECKTCYGQGGWYEGDVYVHTSWKECPACSTTGS